MILQCTQPCPMYAANESRPSVGLHKEVSIQACIGPPWLAAAEAADVGGRDRNIEGRGKCEQVCPGPHRRCRIFFLYVRPQNWSSELSLRQSDVSSIRQSSMRKKTGGHTDRSIARLYRFQLIKHVVSRVLGPNCKNKNKNSLLPPLSTASQCYSLRQRTHSFQLPVHSTHLSDCNFLTRVLYNNCY